MFPIKYIDNNLVWNKDNEVFAYYELIPYNYSFLSAEQKFIVHDSFRQLIAQSREGKIHALQIATESSIRSMQEQSKKLVTGKLKEVAYQKIDEQTEALVSMIGDNQVDYRFFLGFKLMVTEEQLNLKNIKKSAWLTFAEFLHEVHQLVDALGWHCVVDGGAHTAHQAVALQVHEPGLGGLGAELLVEVRVRAGEGDVHGAAVAVLHRVVEELLTVQIIVQDPGLGFVDLLHVFQTADVVFQILEHQTGHVDAPAGGRVVHAVLGQQGGVVHHSRYIVGGMAQQVVPDDGDGHTGGGDVLLDAEVDAAVLGDVHGLGEDHGAHIRHQRHTLHLRHLHILGAEDGVVLADVDVACILVVVDGVHVRDVGEVLVLAGSNNVHLLSLIHI